MTFISFSPLNEGNGTVETLLEDLERLEKVTILLDQDKPGTKTWRHFALPNYQGNFNKKYFIDLQSSRAGVKG